MTKADDDIAKISNDTSARRANPIDVHVGSRVRLRRMMLGLSQEKLADQLGLTFQQVQKYEKGINRVGASRLFELATALEVPVQFFFDDLAGANAVKAESGGFSEAGADSFVFDFLYSREGLELNRAFARIADSRVRKSVIDLVRALAAVDASETEDGA